MLDSQVHNWIVGGTDPQVGIRLFMDYGQPLPAVARMLSKQPDRYIHLFKVALCYRAGLPIDIPMQTIPIEQKPKRNMRAEWPFLADASCPPELKLLIADKITAYTICVDAHTQMLAATNPTEQLSASNRLVTNFIENHCIYKELQHYKSTGKILGEHPIFAQYARVKSLRTLNTMDLFKKKKNLEHNIWRNKSNMEKDPKSELTQKRLDKIKQLEMELAEVDRLLS